MATWFGHTQTLATVSKSVSTVAGGIIGLESNLSNFMSKVVYYDSFFKRRRNELPAMVTDAASQLFKRCYEYRDEVREELESSVAYVADAGRWVVGMDDWNTKMERRLAQISELVLLANSLLAEYQINTLQRPDQDELKAYLDVITSTIVLHNPDEPSSSSQPVVDEVTLKTEESSEEESDNESMNPFSNSISTTTRPMAATKKTVAEEDTTNESVIDPLTQSAYFMNPFNEKVEEPLNEINELSCSKDNVLLIGNVDIKPFVESVVESVMTRLESHE